MGKIVNFLLGFFLIFLALISYPNPIGDLIGFSIPLEIVSILLIVLGLLILFMPIYRGGGNVMAGIPTGKNEMSYISEEITTLHKIRRFVGATVMVIIGASSYLVSFTDVLAPFSLGSLWGSVSLGIMGLLFVLDIFATHKLPPSTGSLGGLWRR